MTAYCLNIFDLLCTLYALRRGAEELNPLMANPSVMVAYKVIVVGVLCWWLHNRPERAAKIGLALCTAVYSVLGLWHIVNIGAVHLGGSF